MTTINKQTFFEYNCTHYQELFAYINTNVVSLTWAKFKRLNKIEIIVNGLVYRIDGDNVIKV